MPISKLLALPVSVLLLVNGAGAGGPWQARWADALEEGTAAHARGDLPGAETLLQEAEKVSAANGKGTLRHARSIDALAYFYLETGRYHEAETLYVNAIRLWERLLGADQPRLAVSLHNLAACHIHTGELEAAEPLVLRAIDIWERSLGADSPETAMALQSYSVILKRTERYEPAAEIDARIRRITER